MAAHTLWCLGYPTQAVQRSQEALALAQVLTHPYSLAVAQHWAAWLHQRRRDVPAVREQADSLLSLAMAQRFPPETPGDMTGATAVAPITAPLTMYFTARHTLGRVWMRVPGVPVPRGAL
jgi:hypothetical protein